MTAPFLEFVMSVHIVPWKTLTTMVPYCRQHIARLEKVGHFPQRVRLGNGPRSRCGWVLSEVETWIEARMTDRYLEGAAGLPMLPPPQAEILLLPVIHSRLEPTAR